MLPQGSYIFSDLERLDALPRKVLGKLWNRLQANGCRMLNHPERSLRRLELLDALHADGSNRFRAFRADTLRRIAFAGVDEGSQRIRGDLGVVVENPHVRGPGGQCLADADVVAAAEALIGIRNHETGERKPG